MTEEHESIERMLDSYVAAVHSKNVDAFITLYRENLRVFDMWDRWTYDGLDAWRAMAVDWFSSLGAERVAVEFEDVQTIVTGDLAVLHAILTIRGLSAEGDELRAMSNRLTWALQKESGGSWKVVHEHTSAPADFDTGKVILQR
jgi:ketosteroid isomerase-like protein